MSGTALDGLAEAIRALVPECGDLHQSPESLRSDPGSYLLLLHLPAPLAATVRDRPADLPAGFYVYAGSARGPGGISARLGRHLRGDGKQRWHIDQVTARADQRAGFDFSEMTECDLIGRLTADGAFSPPVAGFGSSDCGTCKAHFLRYAPSSGS
ncbi:DUF123 domain-containing protein [Nisaea acidiphila]|uniref:DUF123 domain-containing protein n=1 Tax=Nisaea acidiphila TaxID=1862145 RepID=A0A9J7AN07_9PROT|nr:DUF123 domain-containing protein [Nisaea acidiphila]UUX48550.1 DUF123 domain-containing protein [Nisaea acidiphila]